MNGDTSEKDFYDFIYEDISELKKSKKEKLKNNRDDKKIVSNFETERFQKKSFIKYAYKRIYQLNGVGGPLHIVLDDLNLDDDSILYCLRNVDIFEDSNLTISELEELKALSTLCAICLMELSYSARVKLLNKIERDEKIRNERFL